MSTDLLTITIEKNETLLKALEVVRYSIKLHHFRIEGDDLVPILRLLDETMGLLEGKVSNIETLHTHIENANNSFARLDLSNRNLFQNSLNCFDELYLLNL